MPEIRRRNFVIMGIVLSAMYWTLAIFAGVKLTIILASSVLVGIGMAVIYSYGQIAIASLRRPTLTAVEQLAVAYTLTWAGIVGSRLWNLWWRVVEPYQPDYLHNSNLLIVLFVLGLGGVVSILAPRPTFGKIQIYQWVSLGIAVAIASALIGAVAAVEFLIGFDIIQQYQGFP